MSSPNSFPESMPRKDREPGLETILGQYGHVIVLNHQGQPEPLSKAADDCPPFVNALLSAESPEQLQRIINALKAPE